MWQSLDNAWADQLRAERETQKIAGRPTTSSKG